jgi:LacI family transcriptional regulator
MEINITDSKLKPVYRQISECIKQFIIDEDLQYGVALPTVKDIAERANVSLRTADRGILELIKEGICFRVPKKGTFVARVPSRQSGLKRICGILLPDTYTDFQDINLDLISLYFYKGMRSEAAQFDMDLIILGKNTNNSIDFYNGNDQIDFKGIAMLDSDLSRGISIAEQYPKLPFIHVNYHTREFEMSPDNVFGIFNDDFSGAYQIMNAMLARGFKRVLILTLKEENDNCQNRVKGYKMALQNADFETSDNLREYDTLGKQNINHGIIANMLLDDFFRNDRKIDIIMCTNDLLAEGATEYIRKNKMSGIEVCGYDNILPEKSKNDNFSTVSIDFETMGRFAIKLLLDNSHNYPKSIKIPPQLIIR